MSRREMIRSELLLRCDEALVVSEPDEFEWQVDHLVEFLPRDVTAAWVGHFLDGLSDDPDIDPTLAWKQALMYAVKMASRV